MDLSSPLITSLLVVGGILLLAAFLMRRHQARNPQGRAPAKHMLEVAGWIAGVASCGLGIVQVFIEAAQPEHPPVPTAPPTAAAQRPSPPAAPGDAVPERTPTPSATPTEPLVSGGYRLEHSGIPLTIRNARNDTSCTPYLAVDFDGSPAGGEFPITRRVTDEDALTREQLESIDMTYEACFQANLVARQNTSVGLLRKGRENGPEQCAAAASGASISTLDIARDAGAEKVGFEVGAALCAITPTGRLARAVITNIAYEAGIDDDVPTVEFELTTWVRD